MLRQARITAYGTLQLARAGSWVDQMCPYRSNMSCGHCCPMFCALCYSDKEGEVAFDDKDKRGTDVWLLCSPQDTVFREVIDERVAARPKKRRNNR